VKFISYMLGINDVKSALVWDHESVSINN